MFTEGPLYGTTLVGKEKGVGRRDSTVLEADL